MATNCPIQYWAISQYLSPSPTDAWRRSQKTRSKLKPTIYKRWKDWCMPPKGLSPSQSFVNRVGRKLTGQLQDKSCCHYLNMNNWRTKLLPLPPHKQLQNEEIAGWTKLLPLPPHVWIYYLDIAEVWNYCHYYTDLNIAQLIYYCTHKATDF